MAGTPPYTTTNQTPPTEWQDQRALTGFDAGGRPEGATPAINVKPDVKKPVLVFPEAAPFYTILNAARETRTVGNFVYHSQVKQMFPRNAAVDGQVVAPVTGFDVATDQGKRFSPSDIVLNVTSGDLVLVTDVSTDTITCVANWGATGDGSNFEDADPLVIVGNAIADGASAPQAKSVLEDVVENYTQIQRTPCYMTGRFENTDLYSGDPRAYEKHWAQIEHARSLEGIWFFSKKGWELPAAEAGLRTTTNGLLNSITTNVYDSTSALPDKIGFDAWAGDVMRYGKGGFQTGSRKKTLFCPMSMALHIESWADDLIRLQPSDTTFGLRLSIYKAAYGDILIAPTPILSEPGTDHWSFMVDLNHIAIAAHKNRNTKFLPNRQGNSEDAMLGEYFSDVGLDIDMEFAHGTMLMP